MIDCHNHMLPGIDDGARDLDYALAMAQRAVESGITDVVLTPHHMNGVYKNGRQAILEHVDKFRRALSVKHIPINIYPGSELHLVPELSGQLEAGEALTYADQEKAALVELPASMVPNGSEQILENMIYIGITPVLAHPERNAELAARPERIGEWVAQGIKMQLTAQSCAGDFGSRIAGVCRYWCERGWVHLIASDAHRTERRAPDMRTGAAKIREWLGEDAEKVLTIENPRCLLEGAPLQNLPDRGRRNRSKKRSRFFWK